MPLSPSILSKMSGLAVPKWLRAERFFAFNDLLYLAGFFGRLVRCKKKVAG